MREVYGAILLIQNYDQLEQILDELKFANFYTQQFRSTQYKINYGPRKGIREFSGVEGAGNGYIYESGGPHDELIDNQNHFSILEDENPDEVEVLIRCIEVLDWGSVWRKNINQAIGLFRSGQLTTYLLNCKHWFEQEDLNEVNDTVYWSSGWTKIYSFSSNLTTIYDSRVSAFINFILVKFYFDLDSRDQRELLRSISSIQLTFGGNNDRPRALNLQTRNELQMSKPNNNLQNSFHANKAGSWILRYLTKLHFDGEIHQNQFRLLDKAAYMLGFDISQLENQREVDAWYF